MPIIPTPAPQVYPSLQGILDLFRSLTNTSKGGVAPNTADFVLPFLNSAVEDVFSDLRTVGAPRLIKDNVILQNVTPRPAEAYTQQNISFINFFNGVGYLPYPTLPADLIYPDTLWQSQSGTNNQFVRVPRVGVLPDPLYSYGVGSWEWREDKIWLVGGSPGTLPFDLKLRYVANYVDIADPNSDLDFSNTFIPILGSKNAITFKMVAYYAFRLSPEQYPLAKSEAEEKTTKLRQEIVLNSQGAIATHHNSGRGWN